MHDAHPFDTHAPEILPIRGGDDALTRLRTTSHAVEVEQLADELTADVRSLPPSRRRDLVEVLVMRLCDESARDDPDAEDALCSALARLGLMRQVGNLVFHFRPGDELPPDDTSVLSRYDAWLPRKYAPTGAGR